MQNKTLTIIKRLANRKRRFISLIMHFRLLRFSRNCFFGCFFGRSFGCFLLGFLVPFLFLRFALLRDLSYSYANQVSLSNLTTPSQVLYLCYAALLVLLYFIVSLLFFPVAVPVVYRKKLSPAGRSLLALAGAYALVISIGVAFGVSLSADYPHPALRIHLRYFIGAAFPFHNASGDFAGNGGGIEVLWIL